MTGCWIVYAGLTIIPHRKRLFRGAVTTKCEFAEFCTTSSEASAAVARAAADGHAIIMVYHFKDANQTARLIHPGLVGHAA